MKLKNLFGSRDNSVKIFPVSHFLLVVISILLIGKVEGTFDIEPVDKLLFVLTFSFFVSCYGPLFSIHKNSKNNKKISRIVQILSLIFGGLYYLVLFNSDFSATYSENLLYFGVIPLSLLGIPLIIALLQKECQEKIRQSRTNVFISIIFGGVAGSVVRGGVAGALGSIEALFDIDINSNRYLYIGIISEILLAGSFVLNYYLTLTENISKKSELTIQPSRLRKIFGNFIFLPLVLVYLLIFGAYGLKILITGVWPKGIIVRLGIGYFFLGTICLDMNYPDKRKKQEIINKILYISFILVACMMICAIFQRIQQYGITINRRFICYIITFIVLFSGFSLIFKNKRLVGFVSILFILGLLSLYGPISATKISFKSQTNRLEKLLREENISLPLGENSLENLTGDSARLVLGTLEELVQKYNKEKIIGNIVLFDYSEYSYYPAIGELKSYLKIGNFDDTYGNDRIYYSYRMKDSEKGIDISKFSQMYSFETSDSFSSNLTIETGNKTYSIDISDYFDELIEKSLIYQKNPDLTDEEKEILKQPALIIDNDNARIIITGISFYKYRDTKQLKINWSQGYLLTK